MKLNKAIETIGQEQIYHVIFSTYKIKEILLNNEIRKEVSLWIKQICFKNDIKYFIYKTLTEHVHILLRKNKNQTLPYIMQLIKGSTTYYFFKKHSEFALDLKRKRLWAHGYHAVEIKNKEQYNKTVQYIKENKDKFKENISKAPGFMPVGEDN